MKPWLTHSGVTHPKNASKRPYGYLHVSDFMDVWLHWSAAVGIDHLISETSDVELRIAGRTLDELPGGPE